jgi:hypothetical protein
MQWPSGLSTGAATGPPMMYAKTVFSRAYMHGVSRQELALCATCHLSRLVALGKLAAKTLKQKERTCTEQPS